MSSIAGLGTLERERRSRWKWISMSRAPPTAASCSSRAVCTTLMSSAGADHSEWDTPNGGGDGGGGVTGSDCNCGAVEPGARGCAGVPRACPGCLLSILLSFNPAWAVVRVLGEFCDHERVKARLQGSPCAGRVYTWTMCMLALASAVEYTLAVLRRGGGSVTERSFVHAREKPEQPASRRYPHARTHVRHGCSTDTGGMHAQQPSHTSAGIVDPATRGLLARDDQPTPTAVQRIACERRWCGHACTLYARHAWFGEACMVRHMCVRPPTPQASEHALVDSTDACSAATGACIVQV